MMTPDGGRIAAIFLLVAASAVFAADADPRAAIIASMPDLKPEQIKPSPVAGLFEVRVGAKLAYVTADGRYLLNGEILELATERNLTEERRDGVRREVMAGISENDMVIFAPARYQNTVTVFTDIDCGYCRKLHQQIADYNARGIRVRYVFFPRSGPGSESWKKAEQVWCSKDRRSALTRSKQGQELAEKPCQPNPVASHYELGREIGLQGTPAIILEDGELIGGYIPPGELAKYLAEDKVARAGR